VLAALGCSGRGERVRYYNGLCLRRRSLGYAKIEDFKRSEEAIQGFRQGSHHEESCEQGAYSQQEDAEAKEQVK